MSFEKKIETVNIFRIQVKMSTFVQFQLKIDENNLNVNKKLTSFFFGGGAKVLFKKIVYNVIIVNVVFIDISLHHIVILYRELYFIIYL